MKVNKKVGKFVFNVLPAILLFLASAGAILVGLCILAMSMKAQCSEIYAGAATYHFFDFKPEKHNNQIEYNNKNYFLAYEGEEKFGAGVYRNSYNSNNYFVYKKFEVGELNNFKLYTNAGFVYGYSSCLGDDYSFKTVCPEISAEIAFEKYAVKPVLLITPISISFLIKARF